jgi:hypothetical protein
MGLSPLVQALPQIQVSTKPLLPSELRGFPLRALHFHATLQESAVVDPDSARDDLALNVAVSTNVE